MLTEERFAKILSILERMGSVTVQQLMTELDASESTDAKRPEYAGCKRPACRRYTAERFLKNTVYSTIDDERGSPQGAEPGGKG